MWWLGTQTLELDDLSPPGSVTFVNYLTSVVFSSLI